MLKSIFYHSIPRFQKFGAVDDIGWEEIVDNPQETDSNNNLVNQPPQFILELFPLFTYALAVNPNQQVVNYDQIHPKFGFDEESIILRIFYKNIKIQFFRIFPCF